MYLHEVTRAFEECEQLKYFKWVCVELDTVLKVHNR